jgi:hypothetical protein
MVTELPQRCTWTRSAAGPSGGAGENTALRPSIQSHHSGMILSGATLGHHRAMPKLVRGPRPSSALRTSCPAT